jgi:hypothetical protein
MVTVVKKWSRWSKMVTMVKNSHGGHKNGHGGHKHGHGGQKMVTAVRKWSRWSISGHGGQKMVTVVTDRTAAFKHGTPIVTTSIPMAYILVKTTAQESQFLTSMWSCCAALSRRRMTMAHILVKTSMTTYRPKL